MDADLVTRLATVVTGVLGAGVILAQFVSYGVNVLKRMLPRARTRRVALPLAGLLLGWLVTALFAALIGLEPSMTTLAIVLLIGFASAMAADLNNAKAGEARRPEEDGKG
jgi:predicted RND superfamily exporter protein